jgi:hypothetical protein
VLQQNSIQRSYISWVGCRSSRIVQGERDAGNERQDVIGEILDFFWHLLRARSRDSGVPERAIADRLREMAA